MIESGRKAVYEAIVRRKSRAAIWRAIRCAGGCAAGHPAEISAWPPGGFRNLGQPAAATLSADETNPLKINALKIFRQARIPGTGVA
ncbi:hypothetical protein [Burkholderia sp. BCC1977]|uniref:hypothetical protein n=1 Tax=Burkholderia sp. BCC1977 TaxID=2817440 RepID=UPI002ABE7E4F|nr:hypothetical protein [Burkholderia sp. BCC1977]